ncbi:MAG: HAD-IIB family hydrolase [Rhodoferax sp.]|uniref:HAD-IIB family hydrolase n=1 Tax=Rhodoferax sp. TaxID=50421 RepID=UPI0026126DFE|nr:HAD-IIB family hydrolase [Rhodoferax sp.]MDD5333872.1 HAD-IIB family hydrolase [Rhodoferax sp.]
MRPLSELPRAVAANVHTVFSDIDDTLTTDGQLTAQAYAALEQLRRAGLRVILITGRPAGWCDHIARMWPVDAVIGENGAFYYWHDQAARKLKCRHLLIESARQAHSAKLAAVRDTILREVPGCAVASDQFCRLYDLAIDFCEDVAPLPVAAVNRIVALMEDAGMTAKISSIHVNGWFGQYDKLSMAHLLLRERYGIELAEERERCLFVGDSPNDAPMFAYLPHAVGVANVMAFAGRMSALPAYVTPSRGGAGFAELAQALITARK